MTFTKLTLSLSLITGLAFTQLAFAQVDQARLTGTVSDASGAILPNVTVKIVNQKTGAAREAVRARNEIN